MDQYNRLLDVFDNDSHQINTINTERGGDISSIKHINSSNNNNHNNEAAFSQSSYLDPKSVRQFEMLNKSNLRVNKPKSNNLKYVYEL